MADLSKEYNPPIDRFRDMASWMSAVDEKLNRLEHEVQRLGEQNKYQAEQITKLTDFARGVRLVTEHTKQS